ncbi:MBL fold metallo-hydrolase RNA specificity domain-containing protein [Shewanella ulleungensis]|uniref:MBL fold hydrolase n=1 Tax=Shewanella ulleungensis TaxID=2282699 RepID=A0ABQ2QSI9_9GAMM|nr:MBL fold metallo-hydrolase [Shewanella ulleungensis]MCL1150895.1 MBL fold metallo-hydrolase [Shewanella ulleungensis]GGP95359.1 MBL fold hydrolase [Shewanella ulleungensis]
MQIIHHGAVNGVTGSCHQLDINPLHPSSYLIDCGLFQGAETAGKNSVDQLQIDFPIDNINALIVTHCHIDHVGRIPYLLAAGFNQPIYATTATAALLPLVIEDALKVGVTRDKKLIQACLNQLNKLIVPIEYSQWVSLPINLSPHMTQPFKQIKLKFKPAGHILGSAYVELDLKGPSHKHRVVFSGDLGATYAPLLASPKSPYRADTLVIESTYGDKKHQGRKDRSKQLKGIIEKAVQDNGVVLIPAFSIGRTQELLYEFEHIIFRNQHNPMWQNIDIIVDSPMAANFTKKYREFRNLWDNEAKQKLKQGRHPLDFEQLITIDSHQDHIAVINYLDSKQKPAIIIAASGMCTGGRMSNYLSRFLPKATTDILFVGYQAQGTTGRDIQQYGPQGGYVYIDEQRIDIKASIHTIGGYSAHADQHNLSNFVKRMHHKPKHIRIVHGDDEAKQALASAYQALLPMAEIEIGKA